MISTTWLQKRKPYWNRLEELLARSNRDGLNRLTRHDLQELGLLYRQTAADLAAVREDASSLHFTQYLNQLLARAHNIIYSGHKASPFSAIAFYWRSYPIVFRRNLNYCIFAFVLFLAGGLAGTLLTLYDPGFATSIIGPQMVNTIERREMWTHSIVGMKPVASSAIMTNNMSVSFVAFAGGIAFGVITIYMMVFNGILIGVIGTACATAGMSLQLWSFVAPHGVLELPAIFIAGGAGLRVTYGLLFPGTLPRKDSIAKAGADAIKLILGCIPLLVIAGIIEAFVSPTGLAIPLKFTLAGALFVLLLTYLFRPTQPVATVDPAA